MKIRNVSARFLIADWKETETAFIIQEVKFMCGRTVNSQKPSNLRRNVKSSCIRKVEWYALHGSIENISS